MMARRTHPPLGALAAAAGETLRPGNGPSSRTPGIVVQRNHLTDACARPHNEHLVLPDPDPAVAGAAVRTAMRRLEYVPANFFLLFSACVTSSLVLGRPRLALFACSGPLCLLPGLGGPAVAVRGHLRDPGLAMLALEREDRRGDVARCASASSSASPGSASRRPAVAGSGWAPAKRAGRAAPTRHPAARLVRAGGTTPKRTSRFATDPNARDAGVAACSVSAPTRSGA